ncbi:hypothetical protein CDO73_16555 [Saccharibacillus sp. O23]|uniref:hypothetical protein n=1 Tax=Saccharibacillus sp. O23 TaxID=2009338 RepID=UPI000B4E3829|nr:hypothetical protein [Saccharibacillus sp. O23]OWR29011.1 hypothetical protein CDO73_16555 [Saccharibacillus sp. O23]
MPVASTLIFMLAIIFAVHLALFVSSKNKSKTDKGFQFVYYKLSYRRRMLRDLILAPFALLIAFWSLYQSYPEQPGTLIAFAVFFVALYGIFFAYNWTMWKKHEKNE